MRRVAITTVDNPYDPFENFNEWYRFDCDKGYGSCQILDRLTSVSDRMTEKEMNSELERGIDELVKADPLNIYAKVVRNFEDEFEV